MAELGEVEMSPGRLTTSLAGVLDMLLGGYIQLNVRVVRQIGQRLGFAVPRLPGSQSHPQSTHVSIDLRRRRQLLLRVSPQ